MKRSPRNVDRSCAPQRFRRFFLEQLEDRSLLAALTAGIAGNSPPTITSNGGNDTASISVQENSTAVTDVDATDSDAGQTLVYGILPEGDDFGKFSINSSTGVVTFKSAPN